MAERLVSRKCPRCKVRNWQTYIVFSGSWLAGGAPAEIRCANCNHTWNGRISRAELRSRTAAAKLEAWYRIGEAHGIDRDTAERLKRKVQQ